MIKEAGFTCTQLAPTKAIEGIGHFNDITPSTLNDIDKSFGNSGLEITVLGCYIEPSIPDIDKRLENVGIFRDNITYAKQLGVSIVGTETTHFNIDASPAEREIVYELLKDSVLRMVEQAEKENVIVGIEPVAEHTLNTPSLARRLLDEVNSDKLKIIFDPVNLVLPNTINNQREIFKETFDLLGDDIVAVHVKDIIIEDNQKTWRNIGAGIIDYEYIFAWLHENKPNIRLLREGVEMDSHQDDRKTMEKLARG